MTINHEKNRLTNALTLAQIEVGLFQCKASEHYEANTGMFGGLTAALLLNAVTQDGRASGSPSALTVNYVKRIAPGSDLQIRTYLVGGGRSITHWRSEITIQGSHDVMAFASVILANRRESNQHAEWVMPSVPAPVPDFPFSPPGSFGQQMQISPVTGFPPFRQPDTKSISWVKERSGRAIDAVQLTYLSDVYPPRIWYTGSEPRPSATLTLSVYFHATPQQLDSLGDDYILSEVTGTQAEHSTMGSQANLWSSKGELLATTEQMCWFQ